MKYNLRTRGFGRESKDVNRAWKEIEGAIQVGARNVIKWDSGKSRDSVQKVYANPGISEGGN